MSDLLLLLCRQTTDLSIGIISFAHMRMHVTDFSVVNVHVVELSSARICQHKLCETFSTNVNINYRLPIKVFNSIQFNSLLKITNNTLVFSITNHIIIYKTTFKSYMQYIIIQLYTYFKKCFLFLMRP